MAHSVRFTVTLKAHEARAIGEAVASGEFRSPAGVLRKAVRAWLDLRWEEAARHAAIRERLGPFGPESQPVERVELLFDAADAKA